MIAILHTELVYSTATAALLALTLTLNRLIARFAPAPCFGVGARSDDAMNEPRRRESSDK